MNATLTNLQPALVWRYFAAISEIPRCSKKETAVRRYVIEQAKRLGLDYRTDAAGNVVIAKPAASGYEALPTVVIQGHLDMVCEKNMGVEHDFDADPIELVVDGDWLRANDTTLGADNGIAVAMMLALLEGEEKTGALECLFTIDEESGLTGALELDPAIVTGRILINLDSEEEGILYIGCAGGLNSYVTAPILFEERAPSEQERGVRLDVRGLRGGHSGTEIHEERGNALVIGGRLLAAVRDAVPALRIAYILGGEAHNAIPRELRVELRIPSAAAGAFDAAVVRFREVITEEYHEHEEGLAIVVEDIPVPGRVLGGASSDLVCDLLSALPNGVLGMSREIAGLVETSTNVAAIKIEGSQLSILTSQRSSREALIDWAAEKIAAVARLAGASYRGAERYPAWTPDPTSTLLETARTVYREDHGAEAEVTAIHAGLECGVIGSKIPGMDMISFGPDLQEVHTPGERLSIPSTERVYRLLVRILQSVGR